MKKNSLLIVLSLCITSVFAQEWKKVCKDTMFVPIFEQLLTVDKNKLMVVGQQMYRSVDGGKSFYEFKLPTNLAQESSIAYDKDTLYISNNTNLFKELPDGKLIKLDFPLLKTHIKSLLFVNDELLVGTFEKGLYARSTLGKWEYRGADGKNIGSILEHNGYLYARTQIEAGFIRSNDKGKTWIPLKDPISSDLVIYKNEIYAFLYNENTKKLKIGASKDNCNTFYSQIDIPDKYGWSGGDFTIVNDTIYLALSKSDFKDGDILRYDNTTKTWKEINQGKPFGLIYKLAYNDNGKLFALQKINKVPSLLTTVQVIEYQLFGTSANDEIALPENALKAYPNPFSNSMNIQCSPDLQLPAQLTLFNTEGSIVQKEHILNNQTEINTEKLPKGMYFIKLKTADQKTTQTKMIKY